MVKNNVSSIKKLNEQINKFSKKKDSVDKTPIITKKELVRKVKAKQIDEKIEKNKRRYPYRKLNNSSTKKIKKIDESIIVDEDYISFNENLSSKDIKELEDRLRKIYSKEILSSNLDDDYSVKNSNKNKDNNKEKNNFFKNDFLNDKLNNINDKLNNLNDKIYSAGDRFINEAVDLSEKNIDSNIEFVRRWDVLSIITLGTFILFILCVVAFFIFILWILNY